MLILLPDNHTYCKCSWIRIGILKSILLARSKSVLRFPDQMFFPSHRHMRDEHGKHHSSLPTFLLFLPGIQWGSSVPWTLNPCPTLTVCSHLLSLPLPPLSISRETDLFHVSVLCEKHPKETEEFFGLLGVKALAERRKGGRVEVQN